MKRRRRTVILLGIVIFPIVFAGSLWSQEKSVQPQRIEARSLNRMIENQEALLLINTASYLECMDARIPGSVCVTCGRAKDLQNILPAKKEAKLIFYAGNLPVESGCQALEEVARQGYTRLYILKGGLPAWKRAGYAVESPVRIPRKVSLAVKPRNVETWRKQTRNPLILDIRSPESFNKKHIDGAMNIPMSDLHQRYQDVPLDRSLLIIDEDGSRSFLAASYLFRKGFVNSGRLVGGMEAWEAHIRRGSEK